MGVATSGILFCSNLVLSLEGMATVDSVGVATVDAVGVRNSIGYWNKNNHT